MELSILDIINVLLKKIWIIVLCTAIGFSSAFLISSFLIPPTYTSTCQMYVTPGKADIGTTGNYVGDYNDLQYAQKLVNSYIIILNNDVFLTNVATNSRLSYTASKIRKMLALSSINNTEFFEVKINSKSPTDSYTLVKTIMELAPAEIIRVKESDSVKIVSPATIPIDPSSPNILLNSIIGAMLGFVIAAGIAILLEILDTRIKSEEDLASHFTIPILGAIPLYDES